MPITPLPVFEADADPANRDALTLEEQHAAIETPESIVVRFGSMKMIGEYRNTLDLKPGCGSKLVVRTHRGMELAEAVTTSCANAGCGKSISRQEMLDYIDRSGGKDYPFHTKGRVLRIATPEDLHSHEELQSDLQRYERVFKELVTFYNIELKFVSAEPILGGEVVTFYYMAEERVDFRELVRDLAAEFTARIEMRQVGARDEARLTADYERCGQHCCCQNFLKVLKPVSMRSAKVQKATLDPLKISGRCGRLMCCLRYEDETYRDLKKNLPHRKTRVGTLEGPGLVKDTKILTQLVLVQLEHDNSEIAVPLEELLDPETCPRPGETARRLAEEAAIDPLRGMDEDEVRRRTGQDEQGGGKKKRRRRRRKKQKDKGRGESSKAGAGSAEAADEKKPRKKRRRRRRRKGGGGSKGSKPAE
ncbi:MAG: regulatory iron-sulfur-containing complex subunit RicT [Planctomycetota bacterium]|nr:regulatory iron-sulfur-containing complex subunit RicT [Planctomycetota bacterium]